MGKPKAGSLGDKDGSLEPRPAFNAIALIDGDAPSQIGDAVGGVVENALTVLIQNGLSISSSTIAARGPEDPLCGALPSRAKTANAETTNYSVLWNNQESFMKF